jgi:hypothetical protein
VLSLLNVIEIGRDGSITWNKQKVPKAEFPAYLKLTRDLPDEPINQFKFSPYLDCDTVKSIREIASSHLDCTYGRCAEGSGRWWLISDMIFPGQPNEPYDPGPSANTADDNVASGTTQ